VSEQVTPINLVTTVAGDRWFISFLAAVRPIARDERLFYADHAIQQGATGKAHSPSADSNNTPSFGITWQQGMGNDKNTRKTDRTGG